MSRSEAIIHFMLSDVEMAGMNGIELGRRVHLERPDIQVLLCSANLAYAADSEFPFLGKPFRPSDLVGFVSNSAANLPAPAAPNPPVPEVVPVAGPVAVVQEPRPGRQKFRPYLMAAGIVLCLIPLGLRKAYAPAEGVDTVNLRTWRGLAGSAGAKAGRPLALNLNLTGIPRHDSYRIELVDSAGHSIWQQVIPASSTEVLQARSSALRAGVFFIRASAVPEGLLREYELRVGENP